MEHFIIITNLMGLLMNLEYINTNWIKLKLI